MLYFFLKTSKTHLTGRCWYRAVLKDCRPLQTEKRYDMMTHNASFQIIQNTVAVSTSTNCCYLKRRGFNISNAFFFVAARISYTRDFLIGLANCPEAKKKPEYLPEHPIVLCEAVSWVNFRFLFVSLQIIEKNCTVWI